MPSPTPTAPPPERLSMNGKPVLWRPAKTVLNLASAFKEKGLCDGPTFSLGDACAYSCSFCYVPAMLRKALYIPHEQPHENVVIRRQHALDILRAQLTVRGKGGVEKPKYDNPTDTRVIYSSPLVDVAANMDLVRETVAACATLLELTHWHIRLLSKSNLLPKVADLLIGLGQGRGGTRPYTAEDVRRRLIFGVSTGTLDDAQAAAFESGCPKVSKRLQSLHQLQDEGFRTFGMICPSLPQRDYAEWADQMATAIRASQCEHIWAEVINVRGESMTRTCQALHTAGYEWQAQELQAMAADKDLWEHHARQTFLAHVHRLSGMNHDHPDNYAADPGDTPPAIPTTRLRFLQYVTNSTRPWWTAQRENGAILL